jgi:hypothetical protein
MKRRALILFGPVLLWLPCAAGGDEALDEGPTDGSFEKLGAPADPKDLRPAEPQWEASYSRRVDTCVHARTWEPLKAGLGDTDCGKRAWPALLAEMYKVRTDKARLARLIGGVGETLLKNRWAGTFHKPFSCPGLTEYYFRFKDMLPDEQKRRILSMVRGVGWGQMSRPDGRMDPIYTSTEFNSENFCWMARLARFQWAHEMNHAGRVRIAQKFVDNWVRGTFCAGRVEWDSSNYFGYSLQPVLVLYDHAPTPKSKLQARAVADWMAITMALHYIDGNVTGPDVRAKSKCFFPFHGSAWPYAYAWFGGGREGSGLPEAMVRRMAQMQSAGFIAWTAYRPPQVAIDIAQRKFTAPVEMHNAKPFYHLDYDDYADWKGDAQRSRRFEFETLYLHRNYTLASLATYRPDGMIGTFSEQRLWGLGVEGGRIGPVQIFGNAGKFNLVSGRCPYEEIGQYRNVMMRIARGVERMWVCIPSHVRVEMDGKTAFADLGSDVYLALIPHGAVGVERAAYEHGKPKPKKGKPVRIPPDYIPRTQYTWRYPATKLVALAMEVGTKAEHGSYAQFKEAVASKVKLTSPGADVLQYVSTLGGNLRMQWMPPTTYRLSSVQGRMDTKQKVTVVRPAGVPPKVWCDGKVLDYSKWQSYHVVSGEKIVEQNWHSGCLTARVGGKGLQIIVDPETAGVQYRKTGD